jgi:fermentation-respiration switch protein FrsA (DUF1100 family)
MTLAKKDTLCPIDIVLEAYSRALEPKELQILPGGHFDGYINPMFDLTVERQTDFLKKDLVCVSAKQHDWKGENSQC